MALRARATIDLLRSQLKLMREAGEDHEPENDRALLQRLAGMLFAATDANDRAAADKAALPESISALVRESNEDLAQLEHRLRARGASV